MSEYGFFVQDDWRVTPKLTLNFGLRYDYQELADPTVRQSERGAGRAGSGHDDAGARRQ